MIKRRTFGSEQSKKEWLGCRGGSGTGRQGSPKGETVLNHRGTDPVIKGGPFRVGTGLKGDTIREVRGNHHET